MHAYARRHAPAAWLWKTGLWLQRSARRVDAWLTARERSREDSIALEAMSERELRDIGLDPGRIHPAPWIRDWPV